MVTLPISSQMTLSLFILFTYTPLILHLYPSFPHFLILTFASLCLSSPSADFNHLFPSLAPSFLIPCITALHLPQCSSFLSTHPINLPLSHLSCPFTSPFSFTSLFPWFFNDQSWLAPSTVQCFTAWFCQGPRNLATVPLHIPKQRLNGNLQGYYTRETTVEIHHSWCVWHWWMCMWERGNVKMCTCILHKTACECVCLYEMGLHGYKPNKTALVAWIT